MRKCKYCGMPMEEDDLFCTRCGKKVPADNAGNTSGTANGRSSEQGQESGNPAMQSRPAGRAGRGMSYEYDPQEDYGDDENGGGRRFDRATIILLSAAAVLLVVLGALLFNIMSLSNSGKDSGKDNEIAVYNDESSREQNLNQGQQTPASGSAADEEASSETQSSSQQTDPSAAKTPDKDTDAEEKKKEEQQTQDPEQEAPDENEDESAAEEDGEYGWVIDEDGNEVYYPREDEEYEGDDQTDGVSQQSLPGTADAESETTDTSSQSDSVYVGADAQAIEANGTADDSDYILAESDSRLYTREELSGLDDNTLQMAINEIYARHGRKFNTESMQEYFNGKSWYSGTVEPEAFDGNEAAYFNEYEIKNRELLSAIRAEREAQTDPGVTAQ